MTWNLAGSATRWRRLAALLFALALSSAACPPLFGQESSESHTSQTVERALSLLHVAASQSREADIGMQASTLFLIGVSASNFNTTYARESLRTAYDLASRWDTDSNPSVSMLKADIVVREVDVDPSYVEKALPKDHQLRSLALERVVEYYAAHDKVSHALSLSASIEDEPYVYTAADSLLSKLPTTENSIATQVFGNAYKVFRTTKHSRTTVGQPADLASLVVKHWRRLPAPLVLASIGDLFGESKRLDSQPKPEYITSISNGKTQVARNYAFRVRQLLPVLEVLDPAQASSLRKSQDLAGAGDTGTESGESGDLSISHDKNVAMESAQRMQMNAVAESIIDDSNSDDAVQKADKLLAGTDRQNLLIRLAEADQTSAPSKAIEALQLAIKDDPRLKPMFLPLSYALRGARVAIALKEDDMAKKFLERGDKSLEKTCSEDSDPDNPNLALKLYWPCTHQVRDFLEVAFRLSPQYAEAWLRDFKRDDIQTFGEVFLASSYLKAPGWKSSSPMVFHKTN